MNLFGAVRKISAFRLKVPDMTQALLKFEYLCDLPFRQSCLGFPSFRDTSYVN